MSYDITGHLVFKSDTVQRTEKFKVREFVLEQIEDVNGKQFSNLIKIQASQNKADLLDKLDIGDEVKVHFNIRGTKWEKDGKTSYFTNLDAWKIEVVSKGAKPEMKPAIEEVEAEEIDDLPF